MGMIKVMSLLTVAEYAFGFNFVVKTQIEMKLWCVKGMYVPKVVSNKENLEENLKHQKSAAFLKLKVAENPVTFKVNKPGIQADRLLYLVKILAHRQFWESSTVHCP